MSIILITAFFSAALALILGAALGFFKEIFAVEEDPTTARIREVLPGANCGACGYPGCDNYASAIAAGKAETNSCTVGGPSVAEKISAITGKTGGAVIQTVPLLKCQGTMTGAQFRGTYTGIPSCRGAKIAGGTKFCTWGCLGFGDCVKVCKFDAIKIGDNGLPVIDYGKCTGCKQCSRECPQKLLANIPKNQKGAFLLCSNANSVRKAVVKACKTACRKCGLCVKICPEQSIIIKNDIPVIDTGKCTSCGTCVKKCPGKVLMLAENVRWSDQIILRIL